VWKPILQQSEPKGALGPSEVPTEVFAANDLSPSEGDSNLVLAETGSEPVSDLYELGTRPEPVPDVDEAAREPPSVFDENVDYYFYRVDDFEKDEEVGTPIVIVQSKPLKYPNQVRDRRRKESKCLRGEQIFHLFVNLGLCKLKPPLLPHNPNLLHLKPLPNHSENPTD